MVMQLILQQEVRPASIRFLLRAILFIRGIFILAQCLIALSKGSPHDAKSSVRPQSLDLIRITRNHMLIEEVDVTSYPLLQNRFYEQAESFGRWIARKPFIQDALPSRMVILPPLKLL
jgi:hypothetical protein